MDSQSVRLGRVVRIRENVRVVDSENEIQPVRRIEILTCTSEQVCAVPLIVHVTRRGIQKPVNTATLA